MHLQSGPIFQPAMLVYQSVAWVYPHPRQSNRTQFSFARNFERVIHRSDGFFKMRYTENIGYHCKHPILQGSAKYSIEIPSKYSVYMYIYTQYIRRDSFSINNIFCATNPLVCTNHNLFARFSWQPTANQWSRDDKTSQLPSPGLCQIILKLDSKKPKVKTPLIPQVNWKLKRTIPQLNWKSAKKHDTPSQLDEHLVSNQWNVNFEQCGYWGWRVCWVQIRLRQDGRSWKAKVGGAKGEKAGYT